MDYTRKSKIWSNTPISEYSTSFVKWLIKVVYDRKDLYITIRVGDHSFQVVYRGISNSNAMEENPDNVEFNDEPIPLFRRIRELTIQDDGTI